MRLVVAGARMRLRWWIGRLATPVIVAIAVVYFLIDALVLSLLRPLTARIAALRLLARARAWIESLGPYPTLALFLVPIVVLEPVKPVGLYLLATGQVAAGTLLLAVGEILKMLIVERLFHVAQPKLMNIRAFAAVYTIAAGWLAWLQALPPWRLVVRWAAAVKLRVRPTARSVWRHVTGLARGRAWHLAFGRRRRVR